MLHLQLELDRYQPKHSETPLPEGYTIRCLADLRDTPQLAEKLFALVQEGVLRSPQSDGSFEDFNSFCQKLLQPYYLDVADSFVIALYQAPTQSEAHWIGLAGSILKQNEAGETVAQSGLTVMQHAHQGQGIAKALKVANVARATALGAKRITTSVHPDNHAMLAINRYVGFTDI